MQREVPVMVELMWVERRVGILVLIFWSYVGNCRTNRNKDGGESVKKPHAKRLIHLDFPNALTRYIFFYRNLVQFLKSRSSL